MAWIAAIAGFVAGLVTAALVQRLRARHRPDSPPDPRVGELSELAGGLAHELRNPLSTIMVNLQLLSEDLRNADPDEVRRARLKVDLVRHEAQRLKDLLDDFLQLAGPCGLERERVDLNCILEHLAEFFTPQAGRAGVRLRVDCSESPLECLIDRRLMEQALLNLLINAQEAMSDGGEIMMRAWNDGGGRAAVEVADTGPGIPPEARDRVFRAFFSTKARGTGLGLPTTQRIIREHRGSLDLHTEPGRGSQFVIRLPLAPRGEHRGETLLDEHKAAVVGQGDR